VTIFSSGLVILPCYLLPFLHDHQSLSSLSPLPEGGDVPEQAVIVDDSQETSVRESVSADSERSVGSSEENSEDVQPSVSAHSTSPPPAASPDRRKRKKNADEEDSGVSKISEPVVEEFSPEEEETFDPFATRTGATGKQEIAAGSLLTPLLDDLSYFHLDIAVCFLERFSTWYYFSVLSRFWQPLMKEMIDIGSRFIGFHDEAETLRGKIRFSYNSRTSPPFFLLFVSGFYLFFLCRWIACHRRTRQ
jgi:hypothetical protein